MKKQKPTSKCYNDVGTMADINPLRYRGYYLDSDTGMYYLQSRYYDPSLRRFINADAAELISDLAKSSVLGGNLFAYCENNGVVSSDESGNSSILQKVLGILKNAVSTIRYILDVIIGCVSRELKSLMKPLYLMTRKNINAKKILTPLKKALSKLNNKLRIVAISLALLTCIAIIASAWRCSNNIKYTMAVIISEIFVMFMCWGIVFLASCLCKLIPYVGFIISIFVSVIGGAVIWLYFNTRRTNVIKNAIYNLLKKQNASYPFFLF